MTHKLSIPKGTRDFLPGESLRRNYIFDTIRAVFKLFGYQPIETPAMENLSTLLGKYGEEGDKLLFRILNSGDFLSQLSEDEWNSRSIHAISTKIAEKGLRYDLTVPFARFVVQHRNDIVFPFKRYQIQPVWRADRPQKGRYREFYQCDVDVIGSDSLLNEVELIQIIDEVFRRLGIRVNVLLNNRKLLAAMAEGFGIGERLIPFTVAIDKLDKIGIKGVIEELNQLGVSAIALDKLLPVLETSGNNAERLRMLSQAVGSSEIGKIGIEELAFIMELLQKQPVLAQVTVSPSLARGLNYYTGTIIEVKAQDVQLGSICGGGRYDDLTGIFGLPGMSGVGVSFGAERIYDVLTELNAFPESLSDATQVLFVNFGHDQVAYLLPLLYEVRQAGLSAELYPDAVKLRKQFTYADARNIPYVVIAGPDEIAANNIILKNMKSGSQTILIKDTLLQSLV